MTATDIQRPTSNAERINALDFCRGVAVLGIFLCNIPFMSRPISVVSNPYVLADIPGNLNYLMSWLVLFNGTQRGLFSMLFGIGMLIFIHRLEAKLGASRAIDIYFRRISYLFLLGLTNVYIFMWHGDILVPYALITFVAFACRNFEIKTQVRLAVFLTLVSGALAIPNYLSALDEREIYTQAKADLVVGNEITEEQQQVVDKWEKRPDMEAVQETIDKVNGSIGGAWEVNAKSAEGWMKYTNMFFLDGIPMFILGMALYRVGVFNAQYSTKTLLITAIVGITIGWVVRYGFTYNYLYVHERTAGAYFRIISPLIRLVLTVGYLAGLLLIFRWLGITILCKPFAAAGQMALTNYLSQSIIAAVLFFGLGWYGLLSGQQLWGIVLSVWLAQLIISLIWLRFFLFGPFEWMWRSLTYGKLQPFIRHTENDATVKAKALQAS